MTTSKTSRVRWYCWFGLRQHRSVPHQFDGARSAAVHALGDRGGAAELVGPERVARDLVERDDRHPPETAKTKNKTHTK